MRKSILSTGALCALIVWGVVAAASAAEVPAVTYLGATAAPLKGPGRMALDSRGVLYVADAQNRGIAKFDTSGRFLGILAVPGMVRGVALNAQDQVLVSHDSAVTVYGADGAAVKELSGYPFQSPNGIAVAPSGTIYVADSKACQVAAFSPAGTFLSAFGSKGNGQGQLNFPTAVAYETASGQVAVADTLNNRVSFFDANGVFTRAVGSSSQLAGPLRFTYPDGIAFDYLNGTRMYVADAFQSSVQVIDLGALPRFLTYIGSYGSGDNQFMTPSEVLFDAPNSVLLVADSTGKINLYSIGASAAATAAGAGSGAGAGATGSAAGSTGTTGVAGGVLSGTPGTVGTVASIGGANGISVGGASWQYPAGVDCRHARAGSLVCR